MNQARNEYQKLSWGYYYNVKTNPNLKFFDLFNDLAESNSKEVIYIIPPKSKFYYLGVQKKSRYYFIWNNILDSLNSRNIDLWNYEEMKTDTFKFNWFYNGGHKPNSIVYFNQSEGHIPFDR